MSDRSSYQRRKGPALPTHFKEWRKHRHLTQQRLADRIGTTKTRVSLKERGEEGWDDAYLAALADALNAEPASLIMRNPLATDAPWSILEGLKPESKEKVIDYIKMVKATEESDSKAA